MNYDLSSGIDSICNEAIFSNAVMKNVEYSCGENHDFSSTGLETTYAWQPNWRLNRDRLKCFTEEKWLDYVQCEAIEFYFQPFTTVPTQFYLNARFL